MCLTMKMVDVAANDVACAREENGKHVPKDCIYTLSLLLCSNHA